MDIDKQSGHRLLRLDRGSAVIEGAVALGVAFLLLAVIVQVAFLFSARASAQAAVDAFARRAAIDESSSPDDLIAEVARVLPGAEGAMASIDRSPSTATATLEFKWDPPGPRLVPVSVRVVGRAPVISPP